jgi:fermentation-respiration switch protein FrsA (DUF1100 family)
MGVGTGATAGAILIEFPYTLKEMVDRKIEYSTRLEDSIPGGKRLFVDFVWDGERLPSILLMPDSGTPVPAALLLHGFTLDKERMSASAGQALFELGVASLALDLPLHGERFQKLDSSMMRSPFELMRRWRAALDEAALALRFLAQHRDVDPDRLSLVGYSLGAYLGLKVAATNDSIKSVILAAAGDLPDYVPFANVARMLADPVKLVRRLGGRPLLMVHGRWDQTIPPEQAERLFEAAREPKQIKWWDSGHILPPAAINDAAQWLAATLRVA